MENETTFIVVVLMALVVGITIGFCVGATLIKNAMLNSLRSLPHLFVGEWLKYFAKAENREDYAK